MDSLLAKKIFMRIKEILYFHDVFSDASYASFINIYVYVFIVAKLEYFMEWTKFKQFRLHFMPQIILHCSKLFHMIALLVLYYLLGINGIIDVIHSILTYLSADMKLIMHIKDRIIYQLYRVFCMVRWLAIWQGNIEKRKILINSKLSGSRSIFISNFFITKIACVILQVLV